MKIEQEIVEINGTRMYYEIAGEGEHDSVDNHEVVRILASGIENCRQLIVPNSGYMTMMENPGFSTNKS